MRGGDPIGDAAVGASVLPTTAWARLAAARSRCYSGARCRLVEASAGGRVAVGDCAAPTAEVYHTFLSWLMVVYIARARDLCERVGVPASPSPLIHWYRPVP